MGWQRHTALLATAMLRSPAPMIESDLSCICVVGVTRITLRDCPADPGSELGGRRGASHANQPTARRAGRREFLEMDVGSAHAGGPPQELMGCALFFLMREDTKADQ